MSEHVVWDKARGELRVLGQRHVAVDMQGLCDHLDLIVGPKVAEVIMNQHEFRQGKDDAASFRRERPEATIQEPIELFADAETVSGVGVVRVTILETPPGRVEVEISNPCVKGTAGAAKSVLFSYWCGVFTQLLDREFKIDQVVYDENRNLTRCRIVPR